MRSALAETGTRRRGDAPITASPCFRVAACVSIALVFGLLGASGAGGQSAGLGRIDFPTSARPPAQREFERGVLALHSFWGRVAREAFQAAQRLDPDFALAYWGEALSYAHPLWIEPNRASAREVLRRLGPNSGARLAKARTLREQGYLGAVEALFAGDDAEAGKLAYVRAMHGLVQAFPDDDEAATLYAHALHTMLPVDESADREWDRVVELLEAGFRRNPQHPGAAHYLIHTFDDPKLAHRGIHAASAYSKIAPAAPHALHMPSHIYVQLGRWDDVVASNEAAFAASDAFARAEGLSLDRRDYHALEWLGYGYLMQGRAAKAREALDIAEAAARETGSERVRAAANAMRARIVVETKSAFSELPPRDPPSAPFGDANLLFAVGFSAAMRGELETAESARSRLDSLAYAEGDGAWSETVGAMVRELDAVLQLRRGQLAEAQAILRRAVALEADIGVPSGPPEVVKPAHELFGEVLLELGQPVEAAEHFRAALQATPRRAASLLGCARAAAALKDDAAARRCRVELLDVWHAAEPDFPGVAEARRLVSVN